MTIVHHRDSRHLSFSQSDLAAALSQYGGEASAVVAKNPKLLKSTFDLMKAVGDGNPVAGISAVVSGTSAGANAVNARASVKTSTKAASFATSELKASLDLVKVTKLTSPAAAITFVGATVVQKTGIAVSLVGSDLEKAQCAGALLELAGSATTTVLVAPTGVLLVLSAASLTVSAYNAYLSCRSPD